MISPTNAFSPFIDGGGLSLGVTGGVVLIGTEPTVVSDSFVALTANATNFVFLNLTTGLLQVNTSGFTSGNYPIATVVTNNTGVRTLTDSRADVAVGGGSSGSSVLTLNTQTGNYAIQSTDLGSVIVFNSSSAIAATIAQAGTAGFTTGWWCYVLSTNTGLVTITPATSTIGSFPQIVLSKNQSCLIVSDGTNYDVFFTKISSPSAASALSAYLTTDAGTAASSNQIVVQDLSVGGVNTLRKGLNVYLETGAQVSGDNYDGLQVNVGATIGTNTSASAGHVEAAEFSVAASGSTVTLPQINAVKARNTVTAGTTVSNCIGFLQYLPTIQGTVTNFHGFELDSPTGGGTITNYVGVNCATNLSAVTASNAFGGVFGGGHTATVSAALLLDNTTVNSGAVAWGAVGSSLTITNAIYSGSGGPNGVVTANPGSLYLNTAGGAGTTLFVKENGTGTNTGWVGK